MVGMFASLDMIINDSKLLVFNMDISNIPSFLMHVFREAN